jgi:hypothetical protein
MTDTPVQPPAARFERVVAALGSLARPYVLYAAGSSAGYATIRLAGSDANLIEKAAFITAAWAGVAALYAAKAAEERGKAKSDERVAIAQATGTGNAL